MRILEKMRAESYLDSCEDEGRRVQYTPGNGQVCDSQSHLLRQPLLSMASTPNSRNLEASPG